MIFRELTSRGTHGYPWVPSAKIQVLSVTAVVLLGSATFQQRCSFHVGAHHSARFWKLWLKPQLGQVVGNRCWWLVNIGCVWIHVYVLCIYIHTICMILYNRCMYIYIYNDIQYVYNMFIIYIYINTYVYVCMYVMWCDVMWCNVM